MTTHLKHTKPFAAQAPKHMGMAGDVMATNTHTWTHTAKLGTSAARELDWWLVGWLRMLTAYHHSSVCLSIQLGRVLLRYVLVYW